MKKTLTAFAAAALLLASSGAFAATPARQLNPADAKALLKTKVGKNIQDVLADLRGGAPVAAECKADFDAAVKAAEAEATACNNVDAPPAGSPLDAFLKLNNIELGQFCGSLSLGDCTDKVLKDQAKFCAKERAKDVAKAKIIKANCEKKVKACADANAAVKKNADEIAKAEKALNDLKAATAGLKAAADAACKAAAAATN